MKVIPLIRASAIFPIMAYLDRVGAPTDQLLQQAHLPMVDASQPDSLVSLYNAFRLLEIAARQENIPHLGILVGQQAEIGEMGHLGQLLLQSITLHEVLTTLVQRLTATHNSGARAWLTHRDGLVWINHQFINPAKIENQQAQYYACCAYLKVIQLATGPQWQPTEVHFQADPIPGAAEHALLAKAHLRFNQPNNAIGFPSRVLSQPLRPITNPLCWAQERNLYQILTATAPAQDLAGSLRQLICSLLGRGIVSIEAAAAAAGTSPRSFQRRLAEAGLNYSQEVDTVRYELASQWLLDPARPITEIAYDLGYTNVANFTRAFKRWAGVPPSQFRIARLAGEETTGRLVLS
jgi:AraC-like DNA-binding protein